MWTQRPNILLTKQQCSGTFSSIRLAVSQTMQSAQHHPKSTEKYWNGYKAPFPWVVEDLGSHNLSRALDITGHGIWLNIFCLSWYGTPWKKRIRLILLTVYGVLVALPFLILPLVLHHVHDVFGGNAELLIRKHNNSTRNLVQIKSALRVYRRSGSSERQNNAHGQSSLF